MMNTIGIVGYGHYGKLLHELIRRFALWINVVIYDENVEPDGRIFFTLKEIAACDAIILAVPRHSLESVLQDLLLQSNLRKETVLVEVCTSKTKPGALLEKYGHEHPCISLHTPWGPEGYNNVGGDMSRLPPIIVAKETLPHGWYEQLTIFLAAAPRRIEVVKLSAIEHDKIIVGRMMYVTHLTSQIMNGMGLLAHDPFDRIAPLSYQDLKRGALAVRGDVGIFLDVWLDEPECQRTFESFVAQVHRLEAMKKERASGK